jgi:hypothetical protein
LLREQGKLPEALKSFRDAFAIRDRLPKSDPGNAGWQSDLSAPYAHLALPRAVNFTHGKGRYHA